MAEITTSRLDNGLTIASVQMRDAHSLSVGVWIKAGARDEQAKEAGIAHFLEHMAFKGTKNRKAADIAEEIESVGGFMNAYTDREETAYFINLLPEYLELAMGVISDIVLHSTLPIEEIERERGVIIQEIAQSLDTPDDFVSECFDAACYGEHALGRSILGTKTSVEGFQQADLDKFMRRYYGAEEMIIIGAGALEHRQLYDLALRYFDSVGQAQSPQRSPPIWQGGEIITQRDLEQCHSVFGLRAPSAQSSSRYGLMILSNLYGGGMSSRLFQQVREQRGLCYYIGSFAQMISDTGVFGVYAGTAKQNVAEMIEVSLTALKNCRNDLTIDEVNRAKQQLKAGILMSHDSVSSMMETSASDLSLFGEIFDKDRLIADIDKVSRDDISQLVEDLIVNGQPAFAMVGPDCSIPTTKQMAEMLS